MNMIKLIYHNEMRILLRNKYLALPLIIHLICWGYVIFSYENQPVHYQELAAVFYSSFQWILMLNLLIVGLFSVYMAGKDHESEFELLVVTYKVKNMEWVLGKWLVTQTYGLCITIITLLVQGIWFLSGNMSMEEAFKNLIYLFFQMEGAFFLLVSFGYLFGVWIKNMFTYICIPALLGIVFLLQANSYGFAYVNPRLNLLSLFDTMFIASPFEGIWGINGVFEGVILHQIAVILLGFIFILVALLLFRPNRRLQVEQRIAITLIILLMIPTVVVSGIRYTQYNNALEQFVHTGKQYLIDWQDEIQYYNLQSNPKAYPFSMERTNLNVQFPAENQIAVNSQLSIRHNGDVPVNEVYVTLHHQLKVTDCTSDVKITCSRENDFLTVHLSDKLEPGEQLSLNLNYAGDMKQYREDGLLQHSFIESDRIYLPKEAGWYPLIGQKYLAISTKALDNRYVQFMLRNGGLIENYPTEFKVTIMNKNEQYPVALTIPHVQDGLYQGTSLYGLSLIGGNFKEIKVEQTRVVGHPDIMEGAKKTTEIYLKWWNYIEEWLEVPMAPKVIYILNHDHKYLTQFTPSQEFKLWSSVDMEYVEPPIMVYALALDLINDNSQPGDDVHLLQRALTWTLMHHFQVETEFKRFDDWYMKEFSSEIPAETANQANMINRYDEKGKEAFEQVVKFLFKQYEQLADKTQFDLEAALNLYEGEQNR
ncbi:ABC transporter permease [Paenibacillus eucommiae]|uniref:ABC transporter permease n=1 Tax=Paenibacillus eucommiae TaxID=1355755 RepID=A0ABS4IQ71_9BACL|nr:hypothetical protein [Paenibacillus eucommiae]MBP1989708.1 hypothetical protein [Paenibacillus eucommiae]